MNTFKIVAFSIIPLFIFVLGVFVFKKLLSKRLKRDIKLINGISLVEGVFFGIISFVPVFIFSYLLSSVFTNIKSRYFQIVFNSFILSSFVEEGIRLLIIILICNISKKFCYKDKTKEEFVFSGIIICGVVGFTFGAFENIIYGISSQKIIIARLLTAVLLHGACGIVIGNAVFQKENNPLQGSYIKGLLLAWGCHGVYNMFCQIAGLYWISILALILLLWSTFLIIKEQKQSLMN